MSFKNDDVLNFYKHLPFNVYGNLDEAEKKIKEVNPLNDYSELKKLIEKFEKLKLIDVGCGGGWLVNSLAYYLKDKIEVTGIDFNPKVIDYANTIKQRLNLKSNFQVADLFSLNEKEKFDIIVSLGVLHHTNNCHEAIKNLFKISKKNSYIFLGLYHKYGREPFLEYFKNLNNKSEENKFIVYKELHKNIKDEKKLLSWFRDQVLHPHETQHTFKEISDIFMSNNFEIISTSINKFEKIQNLGDLFELEKSYKEISIEKLKKKEYFPGFFVVVAKNKN